MGLNPRYLATDGNDRALRAFWSKVRELDRIQIIGLSVANTGRVIRPALEVNVDPLLELALKKGSSAALKKLLPVLAEDLAGPVGGLC